MPRHTIPIISLGSQPAHHELLQSRKHGIIPIKFCYPKEGGDQWSRLRREHKYTLGRREYLTLVRALQMIKLKEPTNIIHLGVGDGIELPAYVAAFNFHVHQYVGVDLSRRMIENTMRMQGPELRGMTLPYFVLSDIEAKGNLKLIAGFARGKGKHRNLFLITGQGVLCSNPRFLEGISAAMKPGDLALFSLEGDARGRRREILRTYDLPSVRALLRIGLRRAGVNSGRFLPALFDEATHQARVYFSSLKRVYLCLASYKPPTESHLSSTLRRAGMHPKRIRWFPATHTYAALCGCCSK